MEDKENDEIIPINDEAPPVPFISNQINNNLNNMLPNNNINNMNLNKSNDLKNKKKKKENKNVNKNKDVNMNNVNKSVNSINPSSNMNNNYLNNFQPFLIKNPIYPGYNMMYFNYFNQEQKNNMNNLYIPYNNQNNNTINKQQIKDNSNLHDLKIDIDSSSLNILDKESLKDIILFIQDFCQIKIDPKFIHLKHNIFKIRKDKSNDIGHLFYIKKNKYINYNNKNNKDNSDSNDDDVVENNNIIKEKISENMNHKGNNLSNFYCEIHDKVFLNTDKKSHYNNHLKCDKCGLKFKNNRVLKVHYRVHHQEFIQKISSNNKINNSENNELPKQNNNDSEEKIKCSDCDLIFDSVELMSEHFYEIHEKNKWQDNNDNKPEGIKEVLINKQKEQEEKKEKNLEDLKGQMVEKKYQNKRQEDNQKNSKEQKLEPYYYECYHDKQKFDDEEKYVVHFLKFHKGDFPFYCSICKRGFWSYKAINAHSRAKGHYN